MIGETSVSSLGVMIWPIMAVMPDDSIGAEVAQENFGYHKAEQPSTMTQLSPLISTVTDRFFDFASCLGYMLITGMRDIAGSTMFWFLNKSSLVAIPFFILCFYL